MDVSNAAVARTAGWLTAWDSHPIHRTGTAGDVAGATWLMSEVEKLGAQPVLEEFTLDRLDPIASYIEVDGIRIEGVPVFDSPDDPSQRCHRPARAVGIGSSDRGCRTFSACGLCAGI